MSSGTAGPVGSEREPGRRSAAPRRRVTPASVLAVLLPVVTLVAALLLQPAAAPRTGSGPSELPLDAASLVCPGTDGPADVGVASLAGDPGSGAGAGSGQVTASTGTDVTDLAVGPGRVTTASRRGAATVLSATGSLAPALLATRTVAAPLAATPCAPTASTQWFTGVGAAADHGSVLELVNPDAGTAIADVTVLTGTGPEDVPALRGVAVPAGTASRFDLSQVVPRRGDLALRVDVVRGRLGASVQDRDDPLDGQAATSDWLPAQTGPATSTVLLGLTRGTGTRRLSIANPGDDEVSVTVRVISPRATFAPEGLDPLRVPPQSTDGVDLDDLLAEAARRGGIGLLVESSGPVTASLRQVTGPSSGTDPADLSLLAALDAVSDPTAVVVPAGRARLLVAAGDTDAALSVTATAADGSALATREVELTAGTAANVSLPRGTALATIDTGGAAVRGAVLVQRPGATVLPLRGLQRTLVVPDTRPGLP